MKIQNFAIDNFIDKELSQINAALLYGPDQGLVQIRKDNIIRKILGEKYDPMLLVKFDAAELLKDADKLYQEVTNISLIAGRKLIVISNVTNLFHKIIKECLSYKNSEDFIILTAAELTPASTVRKLFETENNIAALPCYVDDMQTIANIVRQELQQFKPSSEIIQYISYNLSGNRLMIMQELQKIKLFCYNKDNLDIAVVKNLLTEGKLHEFQDLANQIAYKNPEKALALLETLLLAGFPAASLIRVISNYLNRILEVQELQEIYGNFNDAVKSLKPPVFFKQKDILKQHIALWHKKELTVILNKLTELEITCKTYSAINSDILIKFFTLIITKRAA